MSNHRLLGWLRDFATWGLILSFATTVFGATSAAKGFSNVVSGASTVSAQSSSNVRSPDDVQALRPIGSTINYGATLFNPLAGVNLGAVPTVQIPFRASFVYPKSLTSQQTVAIQAALQLLFDDDGSTSLYSYDANGRLTVVAAQGGGATAFSYDPLGNILSIAPTANTLTAPTSSSGAPPSNLSFSPPSGGVNTVVTVTGSALLPVTGQTVVLLGSTVVSPSTLTNTQIVFPVPAKQGTAPIRVITPYGTAVTPNNFVVPLNGVTLTSTVPLTIGGGAQTLTLTGTNTSAAYSFTGQISGWVSLQLSSLTTAPNGGSVTYTVYGPNNQSITTGSVSSSALSAHLPPLPASGTYLLVFNSGSSSSVSVTGTINNDPTLAFGSSSTFSIALAGQSQRVMFTGGLQTGSLTVADFSTQTTTPSNQSLTPTFLSTTAATITTLANVSTGAGTYFGPTAGGALGGVLVSAAPGITGSAQIFLDTSSTAVTVGGTSANVATTQPGQARQVNFAGTAGQTPIVALTGLTMAPSGVMQSTTLSLYGSGGDPVAGVPAYNCTVSSGSSGSCSWTLPTLIASDQYTLVIAPVDPISLTFNGTVTLSSVVNSTLTGGQTGSVNLSSPGRTELIVLSSANQPLLVNITGISVPSGNSMYAVISGGTESGAFETNNASSTSMLFFVSSAYYSNTNPLTLQLVVAATGTPVNQLLAGFGTGGTGSAQVYLDTTPIALTFNQSSSINNIANGLGRMASFNINSYGEGVNLTLSNTSISTGNVGMVLYAPGGNFFTLFATGPNTTSYIPSCPSSGSCGPFTFNSQAWIGKYLLVFMPCSSCVLTTPTGQSPTGISWFSDLPGGPNTTFTTHATLTAQ